MPPVRVRNSNDINQKLSTKSVENGFILLPSYTYLDENLQNDVHYSGCPYSEESIVYMIMDSTYKDVSKEYMPTIA